MNFREQMTKEFSPPGSTYGEEAYGSDFAAALSALRSGRRVARSGWNGKGMWLCLVSQWISSWPGDLPRGLADISGNSPFIAMKTADNKFVPWLASQTDILADDWEILLEAKTP